MSEFLVLAALFLLGVAIPRPWTLLVPVVLGLGLIVVNLAIGRGDSDDWLGAAGSAYVVALYTLVGVVATLVGLGARRMAMRSP